MSKASKKRKIYSVFGLKTEYINELAEIFDQHMERIYNPNIRENDSAYLLRQVQELVLIASQNKSSSPLIYACLDARIALEILDLHMILHSVAFEERQKILEDSKPKNGIDYVNKKQGSLKEKYQYFFQALCEVLEVTGKFYDFKKSKNIQYRLSTYIHSYYMSNNELKYDSPLMQNSITILKEFELFIKTGVPIEDNSMIIIGFDSKTMPEDDKKLLAEWKISNSMTYEDLKIRLKQNHSKN